MGVPGRINSVYTIGNCDWTDPVWYSQADPMQPQKWAHNLEVFSYGKDNPGWPKLPLGFRPADPCTDRMTRHNNAGIEFKTAPGLASDGETVVAPPTPTQIFDEETSEIPGSDCRHWTRARRGIWSWSNRDIHIAPWIQSNEMVVVEWSGIKKNWKDDDIVSEELDVAKFIKLYVQFAHERDFGSTEEMSKYNALKADALADLIHERKERLRRNQTDNMEWRDRYAHELRQSGHNAHRDDLLASNPLPTVTARHGIGSPQNVGTGQSRRYLH